MLQLPTAQQANHISSHDKKTENNTKFTYLFSKSTIIQLNDLKLQTEKTFFTYMSIFEQGSEFLVWNYLCL